MEIKYIIIAFFLITLTACSIEQAEEKKGPENSWWLGGADGGAYIKITDDNNVKDDMYQGVIFFDHDNTVWYRGPFRLVGDLNFSIDNHELYLFWDGERIHMQQDSYLEATKPVPPL